MQYKSTFLHPVLLLVIATASIEGCGVEGPLDNESRGEGQDVGEEVARTSQEVIPGTTTPAANGSWDSSPSSTQDLSTNSGYWSDQQISVSRTHVVVTQRASIGYYTRQGTMLQHLTGNSFFSSVLPPGSTGVFDLRTVYDEYRNRFVVTGLANASAGNESRGLIAVSVGSDPRSGWCVYWVGGPSPRQNYDYDQVAVSATAYIMTYTASGLNLIQMLPAAAMASCSSSLTGMWTFYNPTLQTGNGAAPGLISPAMMHHTSVPTHDFFYAVTRYDTNKVTVWKVTDPILSTRTLQAYNITLPGETFLNAFGNGDGIGAPQSGTTFKVGMYLWDGVTYTQPLKAVYNGAQGELAFVTNDAHDWGSGTAASIRVVALVPESSTIRKNRKWGASGFHYGWPSIESNSAGDYAISFMRTGSSSFPEARYSAWGVGDADIRGSSLMRTNGIAYSNPGACGSYCSRNSVTNGHETASATRDPDGTSIWFSTQLPEVPRAQSFTQWVNKVYGNSLCSHEICSTGGALVSGCQQCVTQICAADSFCCSTSWDSICVGEVASICSISCP
jgi:hypothetical protein